MIIRDYLKAEKGKYRVVCVDTFDGTDWIEGDYVTKEKAITIANKNSGNMLKAHVYDDKGNHLYNAGSF